LSKHGFNTVHTLINWHEIVLSKQSAMVNFIENALEDQTY